MRGADERGHVANFVETEQALLFDTGATASYVQVREEVGRNICFLLLLLLLLLLFHNPKKRGFVSWDESLCIA